MGGRSWSQSDYRYGFQGQEQDQEYYGGAVSYKYRIHDPRIGRFLSIDPLAPDYPWNSPYAFSENRVVDSRELEGLEKVSAISSTPEDLTNKEGLETGPDYSGSWQEGEHIFTKRGAPTAVIGAIGELTSSNQNDENYYWHSGTYDSDGSVVYEPGIYSSEGYNNIANYMGAVANSAAVADQQGWAAEGRVHTYFGVESLPSDWEATWGEAFRQGANFDRNFFPRDGGDGITAIYPETILLPLPKLGKLKYAFPKISNSNSQVGRVFWSGGGNPAVEAAARQFATENGLVTLEMTRAGQNLINLTKGLPWSEAGPMWHRMSAAYARGAKGTVHVFHNSGGISLRSAWGTVEYPILNQNGVNIIYHLIP